MPFHPGSSRNPFDAVPGVPGGGSFGPFEGDPCMFLSGAAKWLCQQAVGLLPGDDAVPGDPDAFTGGPFDADCTFPSRRDPVTGECKVFIGDEPGRDRPGGIGQSMHANGHRDHVPAIVSVRTRRCRKGSVLGKDGWCHPKSSITNKDREYPRGTRPLGTPGEMKAVTKASNFAKRLKTKQKQLKKVATALGQASCK